jgi:hypothetical protein
MTATVHGVAACFTLQDAIGDVWSIKIVTNSRTKVGCHFNTKLKMMDILTCIHLQVEVLNHAYANLAMDFLGQHFEYPRLTYKTFGSLVLNNDCPWESVDIGKGVVMDRMVFPAVPV